MTSGRIQYWPLSMYGYEIQYKPGMQQDACSFLLLPDTPLSVPIPGDNILLIDHLNSTSVKVVQIYGLKEVQCYQL